MKTSLKKIIDFARNNARMIGGAGFLGIILAALLIVLLDPSSRTGAWIILWLSVMLELVFVIFRHRDIRNFFRRRATLYGANTIVLITAIVGILPMLNFISPQIRISYALTETTFSALGKYS